MLEDGIDLIVILASAALAIVIAYMGYVIGYEGAVWVFRFLGLTAV